ALNADLPFDQFTVQQLAGDLLPGASTADRVATGFLLNSPQDGGSEPGSGTVWPFCASNYRAGGPNCTTTRTCPLPPRRRRCGRRSATTGRGHLAAGHG